MATIASYTAPTKLNAGKQRRLATPGGERSTSPRPINHVIQPVQMVAQPDVLLLPATCPRLYVRRVPSWGQRKELATPDVIALSDGKKRHFGAYVDVGDFVMNGEISSDWLLVVKRERAADDRGWVFTVEAPSGSQYRTGQYRIYRAKRNGVEFTGEI